MSGGSVWYLVSMRWWTQWHAYVNQQQGEDNAKSQLSRTSSASSSSSLSSSHVTGGVGQRPGSHRLESAVALSDTPSVVGTSYLQINHEAVNNGCGSRSAQASPMHTRKAGTVVARPRHVDNLHLVQVWSVAYNFSRHSYLFSPNGIFEAMKSHPTVALCLSTLASTRFH